MLLNGAIYHTFMKSQINISLFTQMVEILCSVYWKHFILKMRIAISAAVLHKHEICGMFRNAQISLSTFTTHIHTTQQCVDSVKKKNEQKWHQTEPKPVGVS